MLTICLERIALNEVGVPKIVEESEENGLPRKTKTGNS